jgi:hypothetical protein
MLILFVDQNDLEFGAKALRKRVRGFSQVPPLDFGFLTFIWFLIEDSKSNGATLKKLKTKILVAP